MPRCLPTWLNSAPGLHPEPCHLRNPPDSYHSQYDAGLAACSHRCTPASGMQQKHTTVQRFFHLPVSPHAKVSHTRSQPPPHPDSPTENTPRLHLAASLSACSPSAASSHLSLRPSTASVSCPICPCSLTMLVARLRVSAAALCAARGLIGNRPGRWEEEDAPPAPAPPPPWLLLLVAHRGGEEEERGGRLRR